MTIETKDLTGLQTKAILAFVSIGTWSGRKYDDKATNTVIESHNAQSDCGRFNKLLVDGDEILFLLRMGSRARKFHHENTLPWNDVGTRLLPTKAYFEYVDGINKHSEEFWKAVEEFIAKYPALVEQRKQELGDLWNESDYPTIEELRDKFSFQVSFAFLPNPESDIRLSLNDNEIEKIRESMADSQRQIMDDSIKDLWSRMQTVVGKIVERLDPGKSFKKSTFTSIEELERFVNLLNVTDDPNISETMNQIKDDLTQFSPEVIRGNQRVRKVVHEKAKDILDKIKSFV